MFQKDLQFHRFCAYGFLKNLRFFEPFLILFLNSEGYSFTQIGIFYGIREIGRNLFELPGGIFADIFGRKTSLVLAFSAYIFSFFLFYFSSGFGFLIVAFLLYAFGDAFRTGTHKAMIMSYLSRKGWSKFKVDYYGITRSWSQFGSAISALSAGILLAFLGNYKMAFLLSLLPYFLELINLVSYPSFLNSPSKTNSRNTLKESIKLVINEFILGLKNKDVRNSILSLSSYTGYYKATKDYLQALIASFAIGLPLLSNLEEVQRSSIWIGFIYFLLFLLNSWASRHSNLWLKKNKSAQAAMIRSMLLGGLAGFLSGSLFYMDLKILAIISFFGIYLFENFRKPIGISQIVGQLNEKVLASALSLESQAETLFAALFALILGFSIDHFGIGISLMILPVIMLLPLVLSVPKLKVNR